MKVSSSLLVSAVALLLQGARCLRLPLISPRIVDAMSLCSPLMRSDGSKTRNEATRAKKSLSKGPNSVIPVTTLSPEHLNVWSKLSPELWKEARNGNAEVRIEWEAHDPLTRIVVAVSNEVASWFDHTSNEALAMAEDLLSSLEAFTSFCEEHVLTGEEKEQNMMVVYKLKLSALVGQAATRCPSWHTDFVPIRGLQTFYGPGTHYVDPLEHIDNVHLQRIIQGNKVLEMGAGNNRKDWKERLMEQSGVEAQQANTGSLFLMVGNAWSNGGRHPPRQPVLHKSPHDVAEDQARVILTLDVSVKSRDDTDDGYLLLDAACTKDCCSN